VRAGPGPRPCSPALLDCTARRMRPTSLVAGGLALAQGAVNFVSGYLVRERPSATNTSES
jgi:hypothetical protein